MLTLKRQTLDFRVAEEGKKKYGPLLSPLLFAQIDITKTNIFVF